MIQISTHIYCDSLFENIEIDNKLLPNQYKEYPYLIIKNFFSPAACEKLVSLVQKDEESKRKAKVKKEVFTGIVQADVVEEYRKTNIYKLDTFYNNYYDEQFIKYKPVIEAYFGIALTLATDVQVLEYKKGFFYVKHADDSSEIIDKNQQTIGFRLVAPQRKLSTVLFATSHVSNAHEGAQNFNGGELMFNYLYNKEGESVKIKAEAGDMIIFPSNPYFSHEVLPVEEGYRLTLVQWHDTI
ncbi:MAG: 2OG-Fe(II) oxygenase [Sulfurovum sp.]|uniref:2OG-Fe(II) oxygenase n=1 Tax=Sulfurovum sp. TaxID=1969726 RepID=UPI0028683685|nr:2OG-Fe(II) oxygenase [Sulfurovum sp.]MCO4844612.1 2OG-Fe(II) oxygenase [Sulfurovum sp.]